MEGRAVQSVIIVGAQTCDLITAFRQGCLDVLLEGPRRPLLVAVSQIESIDWAIMGRIFSLKTTQAPHIDGVAINAWAGTLAVGWGEVSREWPEGLKPDDLNSLIETHGPPLWVVYVPPD